MSKELFYQYVSTFLENPILEKLKTDNEFDLYICNVPSYLFQEYKYIFCYVFADDSPIRTKKHLSELAWVLLETKISQQKIQCPEHTYNEKKKMQRIILKLMKNDGKYSEFFCEYPFKVQLYNPVENVSPYGTVGNLISSIELYHTKIFLL